MCEFVQQSYTYFFLGLPFPFCDSAQSGVSEAGIWWDKFHHKQGILSQL